MFARSLALVDECRLTHLHVFPFSARLGTPAARMPQLQRQVIKDRARRLRERGAAALRAHLDAQVGRSRSVLTESRTISAAPSISRRSGSRRHAIRARSSSALLPDTMAGSSSPRDGQCASTQWNDPMTRNAASRPHRHQHRAARTPLRAAFRAVDGKGDRPDHGPLSRVHRSGAVLCARLGRPGWARLLAARRRARLRARARREDVAGARPSRQQPHRQPAQHIARSARGAAVSHPGLRRDHPGQRPCRDFRRSRTGRKLHRQRQGAARGNRR